MGPEIKNFVQDYLNSNGLGCGLIIFGAYK